MIKPVPDPPRTAHTHFATCNGSHPPLFAVCEGARMEDALVHLSLSLASAWETNFQVCESASKPIQGLAWATQHSLEICQALVESLLKRPQQK
ncbi:hypothetical protein [Pseudomonas japonica]|uniref:DUF3077 domain-containing protein n=1 Tax=Pseudomonas japonica TaxID=256466 RepID=A0A239LLR1_9PSED|nr:hypothetical protein [Pseudomonas japonica]SNT31411.1 hypothetical protein SAMN05444352_13923 [Pseudomonas japonica]